MSGFGTASSTARLPLLDRAPDQVAYVVPELRPAVERMARVLGVGEWLVWDYDGAYVPRRRYLGEDAEYRSIVAMPAYGPALEIIQPLTGPSIYTTFLEERGAGLHHIGYYVPSVADARAHFAALGVAEVLSGGGHGVDGDGEYAFFDLRDVVGSYVEAIEAPARRHPPHDRIRVAL
ncbi:VOC family protein [Protaetiibacter mangrovi]|uniref:VOC family protein n=1 Tax=Protaetiibacter mangrovi TaxID=2970926 RepID=A0ABT1ZDY0_9MICO|nr:VOC family protein [Protaetiibacter mangrovi]MCS0498886.1 VOC family protein [Protaetiibacter mangrovi]